MTPKNRTLEGKNWMLGGDRGSKIVKNRRTSFMDDPLDIVVDGPFIYSSPFRQLNRMLKYRAAKFCTSFIKFVPFYYG